MSARPPQARGPARAPGFTLLEVMIALAILAVSLVAIAGVNSGAISMHSYGKKLTVATLLARGKMADLESKLHAEGLPADDESEDGTFDKEGYPEVRWEAQIIRPKTEDVAAGNLLDLAGAGGDDKAGAAGPLGGLLSGLGGMAGAAGGLAGAGGAAAGAAGALGSQAAGMLGGVMQSQLQRMLDDLGKSVREVRLTVSWKDGAITDKFTVVTHVVSLGPGTDQVQSNAAAQAAPGAAPGAGGAPASGLVGPGGVLNGIPGLDPRRGLLGPNGVGPFAPPVPGGPQGFEPPRLPRGLGGTRR